MTRLLILKNKKCKDHLEKTKDKTKAGSAESGRLCKVERMAENLSEKNIWGNKV